MNLTLEEAKLIVDGAIEKAKELNIRISAGVCDAGGRLIALRRMDGGIWAANYGAEAKSRTAVAFGTYASDVRERAQTPEGQIEFEGIEVQAGPTPFVYGAGVPIYRGGVLVGACGVGGGTGDEDDQCAFAGVAKFKG